MHAEGESRLHAGRIAARALAAIGFAVLCAGAAAQQLRLANPSSMDRVGEVVEIPLAQVIAHLHLPAETASSLVASNTATGQRIPSQAYASQPDVAPDTLLLLVSLPAHGVMNVSLRADPAAPAQKPLVFGRAVPERKDDFAWENETVTYRIYGPALQAAGQVSSGIDVWSKRVPSFVIDDFYRRDIEGSRAHNPALSYHKDTGVGLDSYDVGPTRGCGGTAVWAEGEMYPSKNYAAVKVTASGPIRFAFELSYAPWQAANRTVRETRVVTLDAGSHLNRIQSTYWFEGNAPLTLAAGIAAHKGAETALPKEGSVASVWDTPQDPSAGRIATGLVALPGEGAKTILAANHALMLFERRSGEPFKYYAGAGWSKADMPTAAAWNAYLLSYLERREHPITFAWKK